MYIKSFEYLSRLLRLSFSDYQSYDSLNSLSDREWEDIYNLCMSHGLIAITFPGLQKIGQDKPSERSISMMETLMKWAGYANMSNLQYKMHKEVLRKITKICDINSVPIILMKGLGVGLNYPFPEDRPCGDIDIYM